MVTDWVIDLYWPIEWLIDSLLSLCHCYVNASKWPKTLIRWLRTSCAKLISMVQFWFQWHHEASRALNVVHVKCALLWFQYLPVFYLRKFLSLVSVNKFSICMHVLVYCQLYRTSLAGYTESRYVARQRDVQGGTNEDIGGNLVDSWCRLSVIGASFIARQRSCSRVPSAHFDTLPAEKTRMRYCEGHQLPVYSCTMWAPRNRPFITLPPRTRYAGKGCRFHFSTAALERR